MNLKSLREALESGKPNDDIKSKFDTIVKIADSTANDINKIKALEVKAENVEKKPLTPTEIAELNKQAIEQQKKIDAFEANLKKEAMIKITSSEIEQLELNIVEYKKRIEDSKNLIAEKEKQLKKLQAD